MRAATLVVLAVALVGCLQTRAPTQAGSELRPPTDGWNHQLSVHLGPRMLRIALPLLVANQSPELPLYFRHLNRAVVSVYAADDDASPVSGAYAPNPTSWEVVLRLRDENATITLLHALNAPTLDRFYFVIDGGEERIIAHAEGDLWAVVRQATRNAL